MGLLSKLQKIVAKPLVGAGNLITKGIEKITGKTYGRTTAEKFTSTTFGKVTTTGLIGTAVAGAVLAAPLLAPAVPKATSIIKAVIPTTIKGKVTAAIATPIIAGAVVSQPKSVAKTITKAPVSLAQFGGNLATLGADPSLSSAKKVITDNPLLSATAGLLVGGAITKTLAPVVSGALTRGAIQEQTEALTQQLPQQGAISVIDKSAGFIETPSISPQTPTLPQTAEVSSTTPRKRRRTTRKPVLPPISQRVNVIVQNKSTSYGMKNYLNRRVLA